MKFNIVAFEKQASWGDFPDDSAAFLEYEQAVMEQFLGSEEGQALVQAGDDNVHWVENLLRYAFQYLGVGLSVMTVADVRELLETTFPAKISLETPDSADQVIPALIPFWQYLGREYEFENARAIIQYLEDVQPRYKAIMNDPARFGPAKSIFVAGQAAGIDMTDVDQVNRFLLEYNARLLEQSADLTFPPVGAPSPTGTSRKRASKTRRQMAKASRKRNRNR